MLDTGKETAPRQQQTGLEALAVNRGALLSALAVEMHEILECRIPSRWQKLGEFLDRLEAQRGSRFRQEEVAGVVSSARGDSGPAALHYAVIEGAPPELLSRLLRLGADPNTFASIDFGPYPAQLYTPLHCAAAIDDAARFRALLAAGARLDLKNSRHSTPVDIAASRSNGEIVECAVTEGHWLDEPLTSRVAAAGKIISVPCLEMCRAGRWEETEELFKRAARMAEAYPALRDQILNIEYRDTVGGRIPPVLHQLLSYDAPIEVIRSWIDLKPDLRKVSYLPPEFGAGLQSAGPLHLAVKKGRHDVVDLLAERGISLLENGADGKPVRILPAVLTYGSESIKKRAIEEMMAKGTPEAVSREVLPGMIAAGKWNEVMAFLRRGVPAPPLFQTRKAELVEHLENQLHGAIRSADWVKVGEELDSLPAWEGLYGGPLKARLLWDDHGSGRTSRTLAISSLITHAAPDALIERVISEFPAGRKLSYHWDQWSPNPICAVLASGSEPRLAIVLRAGFALASMTEQNEYANPLVACLKGVSTRPELLAELLEFIEREGALHPREAALILLGGLGSTENTESQKQILDSMRAVRKRLPAAVADTGVLELRAEHAELSPAEVKKRILSSFGGTNERWRIFQMRFSLSDAISYFDAFEDVEKPQKMPPGVPGPFLRLLPRVHESLDSYPELLRAAGRSRRRESELFALLSHNDFDTRRHIDYQPGTARLLYDAISESTGEGVPSPESATVFRNIGNLAFAFQRWNFDTKSIKDPDGSRILPCLMEQYGLKPVNGVFTEQLGLGFELPDSLKNFTTWITTREGKRRAQKFDPKFHLVLRRSYLLASHPDWGRIVIPNPVLTSGREVLPRGAYWSAEHATGDLSEHDFKQKRSGGFELAGHFKRLSLTRAESRRTAWSDDRTNETEFEVEAAGMLVDALRAWSEEYQGWKFDTRFETAWNGKKQLLGGPRSRGFKTVIEQMEYMQLAMQTKTIPFTHMQLIISPPDRPTYQQLPFPGLDGKVVYNLTVTDDVIAEMKRGSQSGMEMEGVYSVFNTALKLSGDLTVLLRR